MSDPSDPHGRAYLMAYAAVETFGVTSEYKNDYAARPSRIGVERGRPPRLGGHRIRARGLDRRVRRLEVSPRGRAARALVHPMPRLQPRGLRTEPADRGLPQLRRGRVEEKVGLDVRQQP